jgi:hypothetical protein
MIVQRRATKKTQRSIGDNVNQYVAAVTLSVLPYPSFLLFREKAIMAFVTEH